MKGRKPLPTTVKTAQGTLRKCRTNENEPTPTEDLETAPDYLSELAKEKWRFICKCEGVNWIKRVDQPLFEQYCELLASLQRTNEVLRAQGEILYNSDGVATAIHPAANLKVKYIAQIKAIASELGLTPSSRSRVAAVGAPKSSSQDDFTMTMFSEEELNDLSGFVPN